MRGIFVAAVLLTSLVASPANAGVVTAEQAERMDLPLARFTCPIGGEMFRQPVTFPHLALVTFPDGSHLGDELVDTQIPECPGNGALILPDYGQEPPEGQAVAYHAYTADELAQLPDLLATPEWLALTGETRTLRAWWLASRLGRPQQDRLNLLLAASWGAESPAQRRAGLEALVEHMPAMLGEAGLGDDQRAFAMYYVINANRELGRFDEALALLERVEGETPGVAMPEDPDSMFGSPPYAGPMRDAIAARDDDRYPIDLLTDDMAGRLCNGSGTFSNYRGKHASDRCAARQARREAEAAQSDAVFALLDDRAALASRCAAGAVDDEVLAEACRRLDFDREWQAGNEWYDRDPAGVFAQCDVIPEDQRDTRLKSACTGYDIYLASAIADLMLADLSAHAAICDAETAVGSTVFGPACSNAGRVLDAAQARRLWDDRSALRQQCRSGAWRDDETYDGLDMACHALEENSRSPYWLTDPGEGAERTEAPYIAALPFARQHLAEELARRSGTTPD